MCGQKKRIMKCVSHIHHDDSAMCVCAVCALRCWTYEIFINEYKLKNALKRKMWMEKMGQLPIDVRARNQILLTAKAKKIWIAGRTHTFTLTMDIEPMWRMPLHFLTDSHKPTEYVGNKSSREKSTNSKRFYRVLSSIFLLLKGDYLLLLCACVCEQVLLLRPIKHCLLFAIT